MIVIRRLVDRRRAYTGIFLKGEPPRIFPTSDQEHARILSIFKQDRPYQDVQNDFAEYALGLATLPSASAAALSAPAPKATALSQTSPQEIEPAAPRPRRDENDTSHWLALYDADPTRRLITNREVRRENVAGVER